MTGRPCGDSAVSSAREAAQGHPRGDMDRGQYLVVAPYLTWQAAEGVRAVARRSCSGGKEQAAVRVPL